MKARTYYRWVGRSVRRRQDGLAGPVGKVVGPLPQRTWWRVEWPSGKVTCEPERNLVPAIGEGQE
jgi:hypothetical protein